MEMTIKAVIAIVLALFFLSLFIVFSFVVKEKGVEAISKEVEKAKEGAYG